MATADVDVRDLDALELAAPVRRTGVVRRFVRRALPPVAAFVALVGAWQLVTLTHPHIGLLPAPTPGAVWASLHDHLRNGDLGSAIWGSVHRAVIGFAVAIVVGTPLGALVGRIRWLRASVQPLISGLQSLPSVAWVPPAILCFGLTARTIYTVVLLGAVPSIANGTISGLDQVPPLNVRVGRVLGARGLAMARFVLLPSMLPTYLAGLRQGWAFAWRSLMAAEIITQSRQLGFGLGQLLNQGQENIDLPTELAAIVLILVVGIIIELGVFAPVERRALRVRGLLVT
jgi:NitT/TauT family transport system permease protein